jgi:hypothetical protein
MGQSRRHADRKVKLDVWRCRIAVAVKVVGILILFVGVETAIPMSSGSELWGLSLWHYIQAIGIFIPVGAWLVVLGAVVLIIGRLISRDWLL